MTEMKPENNRVVSEGTAPFDFHGETLHTWYKLFGDLSTSTSRPLVVLHGGPGVTHDYLNPLGDIAALPLARPVILYDQMGNGHSTHLQHKDPSFWNIDLFIDELTNLLVHLHIADNFDLLGHSWGGMLAAEFIIRRQPSGLKSLILANSLASVPTRNEEVKRLYKQLPEEDERVLLEGDASGNTSSEEYSASMTKFNGQFLCRMNPLPEEVIYSFVQSQLDPTVYSAM